MKIEDFFTFYKDSAWQKDADSMIDLYNDKAMIFDMWDEGFQAKGSEWAKSIRSWLSSLGEERVKVEFEMVDIHQADNVGFASALIKFAAISKEGAVLRSMKNRITLGFSKVGDAWKVVHQHTSAPINSNGLTAILDI